jgi:hypothetical protein
VDRAERSVRKEYVSEIEKSMKRMAKKHVREGINGPVIRVLCDPVAGGTVEDLSEKTTVFQCFLANKDNKAGQCPVTITTKHPLFRLRSA